MSPINEPPDNQLTNHSFEVDSKTFAHEHSDSSYEDTVGSADDEKQEPVLTRLYEDKVIRGFPTTRLDFTSDDELDCALGELVGELVWDSPIGISQQSVQTGIVRKAVLYLPDEARTSYCWDNDALNKIADRTGVMVVGDRFQYETDNSLMSFVSTSKGMEQLATNEIELFLFVPHHYAENSVLAKHYYEVMRSAKEAGVKCKYLLPKLVRTRLGETKLGCENTMFRSHRPFGRDEAQSRDAVFNRGALYWDGQLLAPKVQTDTQLIINLLPCNQADLQAELHAVKVADTLSLPVVRTAGTPETLDDEGRFPAFEIPTDKTLTVIRSPHGAGKTHNLARFCEKVCREGHAVIHILPRTSLVQQARVSFGAIGKREMVEAEAFKDVSSVSELLFPTDTNGAGRQIAFCVESLAGEGLSLGFDLTKVSKAIDRAGNEGKKIFLVLDEFPSVLTSVLTSETISSPAKTMRVFRDLLCLVKGTGGSVLAMSADLSSTEVSFLIDCLELRDEEGKVNQDELFCVSPDVRYPQSYKREIVLSTKKEATIQRIYEAVERRSETSGGAVLVMMNSLKVETPVSTINLDASIREKFPDAKTLVLDSRTKQTDKEAQDFLSATPEEQMRLLCDYHCVLATSIIESGLNWDNRAYDSIPDDFVRSIFVIDNGKWGADNILQASMRVRNQAIPCEVFTPKRNNSLERPRLGFYPSLDESLASVTFRKGVTPRLPLRRPG